MVCTAPSTLSSYLAALPLYCQSDASVSRHTSWYQVSAGAPSGAVNFITELLSWLRADMVAFFGVPGALAMVARVAAFTRATFAM